MKLIRSWAHFASRRRQAVNLPLSLALGLLTLPFCLGQQSVGTITGIVRDPTGVGIPGAKVYLTNPATMEQRTATSDADGKYLFPDVPVGSYELRVEYTGFATKRYSNVELKPVTTPDGRVEVAKKVDVTLELGGATETVTVSSGGDFGWRSPRVHRTFTVPVWNVWTEKYQSERPTFKPAMALAGQEFLLVVDLSALKYDGSDENATYSHEVGEHFDKWLHESKGNAPIQILAIPDGRFFERQDDGQRVRPMSINVAQILKLEKKGFSLRGAPLKYLAKHHGKAAFSFVEDKAAFRLRARKDARGVAPIALSVWADGKPIDEISYPACVAAKPEDSCNPTAVPTGGTLRGVDVASHGTVPDAALHLIEMDSTNLVGVFRCNTCGWKPDEYKTWRLGRSADWFREQFANTVLREIALASVGSDAAHAPLSSPDRLNAQYDESMLLNAGEHLYGLIFHSADGEPVEAEVAFRNFVSDKISHEASQRLTPSLFARLLPQQADKSFIVPTSLARVEVASGRSEFLGFHFRIQTPLEMQDYSTSAKCISKWTVLVPPDKLPGNPLAQARELFSGWIKTFEASPDSAKVYDDLVKFKSEWIKPTGAFTVESSAVLILSHHEKNTFHFDADDAGIFPDMTRHYATPSIVIMAACETANPGSFEFVREFNLHGASAVIASAVDVPPTLGGALLASLADALDQNVTNEEYTLDRALFDALTSVGRRSDGYAEPHAWGPRVLIFELIGNGGLRVCVPHKAPQAAGT